MNDRPLIRNRAGTVLVALVTIAAGAAVVFASTRGVLPRPLWDWVKRLVAAVGLLALSGRLLGPERVATIRQWTKIGLRQPGLRLLQGAGEIVENFHEAQASALNRRGAQKTGHYAHMTRLGGGRNAEWDPDMEEWRLTNPYDVRLVGSAQAFRDSQLYWIYRLLCLVAWILAQVITWRYLTDGMKPQPPGIETWFWNIVGIVLGGLAIAWSCFLLSRLIAVVLVAILGISLGTVAILVDLLLLRPTMRIAQLNWLKGPIGISYFITSATVAFQDLFT